VTELQESDGIGWEDAIQVLAESGADERMLGIIRAEIQRGCPCLGTPDREDCPHD
jgi:hypothetical protein